MTDMQSEVDAMMLATQLRILRQEVETYLSETAPDDSDALSVDQVAELLQLGTSTIHRLAQAGRIPFHKKEWRLQFSRKKLIEWIKHESG